MQKEKEGQRKVGEQHRNTILKSCRIYIEVPSKRYYCVNFEQLNFTRLLNFIDSTEAHSMPNVFYRGSRLLNLIACIYSAYEFFFMDFDV